MFKMKVYQNYEIVTQRKLYDYLEITSDREEEKTRKEEKFHEELVKEQSDYLAREITTENVILHFLEDSAYLNESYEYVSKEDIEGEIQCLAIKDGVDLVRFSNGNLGFVAYYNGHENGFEIIPTEMTEREFEEVGQDMDWADYI